MYYLLNREQSTTQITNDFAGTTVLEYLRGRGLTGTKEACASGDCGACTAVVGELETQAKGKTTLVYKSINTCIALMGSLAGKHLVTVEGLADGAQLHPVQKAMVEHHGSQCGFCTPGFVMSMFALYQNQSEVEAHDIEVCLAGNLCRCTGYQPIINAVVSAFEQKTPDYYQTHIQQTIELLQTSNTSGQNSDQMADFMAPNDLQSLAKVVQMHPQGKLVAGGTDLNLEITQALKTFSPIISLSAVTELQEIVEHDQSIEINAGVRLRDAWSILVRHYPNIEPILYRFASTQIRNWATVCGNIANASPIGDLPPIFIALGASLVLRKGEETRSLALEQYFLDYRQTALQQGEFIQSVVLPKLKDNEQFKLTKISKRIEDDISTVFVAAKLTMQDGDLKQAVVALGGMAGIPKRAEAVEQALIDTWQHSDFETAIARSLSETFQPLSDVRASAQYRLAMVCKALQKYRLEMQGTAVPTISDF